MYGCRCKTVAPNSYIQFTLSDVTGADLIDSLYTTPNYELIEISSGKTYYAERKFVGDIPVLQISYENLTSAGDYKLKFSESDIDTVSLKYTSEKGKCHQEYNLIEFKYNSTSYPIINTDTYYQVVK